MTRLTDEQLADLERDYSSADQQKCRVCGDGLKFAASMNSLTKYACGSPEASIIGNPLGGPSLDHYRNSEWYDQHKADPRIVALVQEVRESRLSRGEQDDLVKVDTAQEVLMKVCREIQELPLPAPDRRSITRYFRRVMETIEEQLRQWGWTGQGVPE